MPGAHRNVLVGDPVVAHEHRVGCWTAHGCGLLAIEQPVEGHLLQPIWVLLTVTQTVAFYHSGIGNGSVLCRWKCHFSWLLGLSILFTGKCVSWRIDTCAADERLSFIASSHPNQLGTLFPFIGSFTRALTRPDLSIGNHAIDSFIFGCRVPRC